MCRFRRWGYLVVFFFIYVEILNLFIVYRKIIENEF